MSRVSDFATKRRFFIPSVMIAVMLLMGFVSAVAVDNSENSVLLQATQFVSTDTNVNLAGSSTIYSLNSYQEDTFSAGGATVFFHNVSTSSSTLPGENSFISTEKAISSEGGRIVTEESMYSNIIGKINPANDECCSEQLLCKESLFENKFSAISLQMASSTSSSIGTSSNSYMSGSLEAIGSGSGSVTYGFNNVAGIGNTTSIGTSSLSLQKLSFGGEFGLEVKYNWDASNRIPQELFPSGPEFPCPF